MYFLLGIGCLVTFLNYFWEVRILSRVWSLKSVSLSCVLTEISLNARSPTPTPKEKQTKAERGEKEQIKEKNLISPSFCNMLCVGTFPKRLARPFTSLL